MGQDSAQTPCAQGETPKQITLRRLGEALASVQEATMDVLASKQRAVKIVLEVYCEDGLITSAPQLMVKRAVGK